MYKSPHTRALVPLFHRTCRNSLSTNLVLFGTNDMSARCTGVTDAELHTSITHVPAKLSDYELLSTCGDEQAKNFSTHALRLCTFQHQKRRTSYIYVTTASETLDCFPTCSDSNAESRLHDVSNCSLTFRVISSPAHVRQHCPRSYRSHAC